MRSLIGTLCLVVLVGCGTKGNQEFPSTYLGAIVRIGTLEHEGLAPVEWTCTGWVVAVQNGETLIVTGKHCLCDPNNDWQPIPKTSVVQFWDPATQEWGTLAPVDRWHVDPTLDRLLLVVAGYEHDVTIPLAHREPVVGETSIDLGICFPAGMVILPTWGKCSGKSMDHKMSNVPPSYVLNLLMIPGYSGGVALVWCVEHEQWEAIGVNSRAFNTRWGFALGLACVTPIWDGADWIRSLGYALPE